MRLTARRWGAVALLAIVGIGTSHAEVPANLLLVAGPANEIISLEATLVVPEEPARVGTVFIWPGLQPGGANFHPIDNGVLQTVLTWGPSCAPGKQPSAYSSWWVSAQYVNTFGHEPGFTGCQGGPIMPVGVGDHLTIRYWLEDGTWRQRVNDERSGRSVSYDISLGGQAQNYALFQIETYDGAVAVSARLHDVSVTYSKPEPGGCTLHPDSVNGTIDNARMIDGGRTCRIELIVLADDAATPLAANGSGCGTTSLRSINSDKPAPARFHNHGTVEIQIFWLDFAGVAQPFGALQPGQSLEISSYTTHAWIAKDQQGTCHGTFTVTAEGNTFSVK